MREARMYRCHYCHDQFTVRGSIKSARTIHESLYCPSYWEQSDTAPIAHPLDA